MRGYDKKKLNQKHDQIKNAYIPAPNVLDSKSSWLEFKIGS